MTQEKRDRIEHWLNHYTNNGNNPIDGTVVTGILKQGLGYTYNAPSISEDIADIALVYAQQQVKKCDLANVGGSLRELADKYEKDALKRYENGDHALSHLHMAAQARYGFEDGWNAAKKQ